MKLSSNWFKLVESLDPFFSRVSNDRLVLSFRGYKTQDCYDAERALIQLGAFPISAEFDQLCGKTFLIVREPKNVLEERRINSEVG